MFDPDSLQAEMPQHAIWLAPEWGPSAVTDYGLASFHRRSPDQFRGCLGQHLIMCTFTPCTGRETTLAGSRIRTVNAPIGACEIIPAGADYWARWHTRKEVAVFTLDPLWLSKIAHQEVGASALQLEVDALPFMSERIRQISSMLLSEFEQPMHGPSRLYTDSLLTLLAMEIVRSCSSANGRPEPRLSRLPKRALDRVTQYMRDQIAEEVTVEGLAGVIGYSANHFLKCFKAETGQTPHKFLVNLRLDLAQELLTKTKEPITEIAFRAGFSSQAHLTSTMMKERATTPGQFRRGLMLTA